MMVIENRPLKMKFFGVKEFLMGILISKLDVKMNLRINIEILNALTLRDAVLRTRKMPLLPIPPLLLNFAKFVYKFQFWSK